MKRARRVGHFHGGQFGPDCPQGSEVGSGEEVVAPPARRQHGLGQRAQGSGEIVPFGKRVGTPHAPDTTPHMRRNHHAVAGDWLA